MLLWFVGTAIVTVRVVFRDPSFDYRLLIVGSVLPLADIATGGAGVLHTLVFSLVLMGVVMLSTAGRRPVRKLLLGLPIGTMLHLVFDAVWTDPQLFWWPLGGWSFLGLELPEEARGLGWDVALEAVGVVLVVAVWRRSHLGDPAAPPALPARRPAVRRALTTAGLWDTLRRVDPRPPRPHRARTRRAACRGASTSRSTMSVSCRPRRWPRASSGWAPSTS